MDLVVLKAEIDTTPRAYLMQGQDIRHQWQQNSMCMVSLRSRNLL